MASGTQPVKSAHINMMVDTIISSLAEEGLRAVMRSILAADSSFTNEFERQTRVWLDRTQPAAVPRLFMQTPGGIATTPAYCSTRQRIRVMMGCGLGLESLDVLRDVVLQAADLTYDEDSEAGEALIDAQLKLNGDIVQAVTAAGKELETGDGRRKMTKSEERIYQDLLDALKGLQRKTEAQGLEFLFGRSLDVMEMEARFKHRSSVLRKDPGNPTAKNRRE